jgi:hypothetical protein
MIRTVALALLLAITSTARAEDEVATLKARVESLERALAELPAAQSALHDLENRIAALERQIERAAAAGASESELRRALDVVKSDLAELERRLALGQTAVPSRRLLFEYDDGAALRFEPVGLVVRLNALAQVRYIGAARSGGAGSISTVDIPHAQLGLRAGVAWLELTTLFDFGFPFAQAGGFAMVRDLWADARPLPWLTIRAGQLRVPFSRQRVLSDHVLTFPDRSIATRALAYDRDLGLLVEGRFLGERLTAQIAVTDGINAGPQLRNDNVDLAYTARLTAQPFGPLRETEGDRARARHPLLSFGIAFQYDLRPTDLTPPLTDLDMNGKRDNIEVIAVNVETALRIRGFAFEGEYLYRRERLGFGRADREAHGTYVQASQMLWRGLELGVRFSFTQLPGLFPPKIGILDVAPRDAIEAGAVVNYHLWKERIKAQLAYTFRDDVPSDPADRRQHRGHVVEILAQAGF